jgi:hypothetical protein
MTFRLADLSDIEGVLSLQEKYLITNIPLEKRSGGFVTTPFTPEQIQQAIALDGLFVAVQDNLIAGYVFAADWNFFSQWPIFPYMVARIPRLSFGDFKLTAENTFQYGPICIDSAFRGSDVLHGLFAVMSKRLALKFPVGLTFINKQNERSFAAHTKKLSLLVVDQFEFNNNEFYMLAFPTQKTS